MWRVRHDNQAAISCVVVDERPTASDSSTASDGMFSSVLNRMDRSLCRQAENSLVRQLGGVGDGGAHCFRGQGRIVCEDLLGAQAIREIVEDNRDHDPRSLDARLPVAHMRVHRNVICPVHTVSLSDS